MQRSGSQTALLVLSILNIIAAVLLLLGGLVVMLSGAVLGAVDSSEAAAALAGSGITQGEAGVIAGLAGFVVVFAGIIELVLGILGVRAANDNQKIMPVWVLAIIQVVLSVITLIMDFTGGSFNAQQIGSSVVSLIVAALILWIANNIKKEAGK